MTNLGELPTDGGVWGSALSLESAVANGSSAGQALSNNFVGLTGCAYTTQNAGSFWIHAFFNFSYTDSDAANKVNCRFEGKIVNGNSGVQYGFTSYAYLPLGSTTQITVSTQVYVPLAAGILLNLHVRALSDAGGAIASSRASVAGTSSGFTLVQVA